MMSIIILISYIAEPVRSGINMWTVKYVTVDRWYCFGEWLRAFLGLRTIVAQEVAKQIGISRNRKDDSTGSP